MTTTPEMEKAVAMFNEACLSEIELRAPVAADILPQLEALCRANDRNDIAVAFEAAVETKNPA